MSRPSVNPTVTRVFLSALFIAAIATFVAASARSIAAAPVAARVIPPPALDAPMGRATSEVAVFAGGCFWGMQGIYQHVKGVRRAVSGYAGGERRTAVYERVSTGGTGHAESVQITFDPRLITYGRLLQIYFSVAHDPTQLNRQGPDVGPQYRSAIFPVNATQADVARAYIAQRDRDQDRARAQLLSRRGSSPGLHGAQSDGSLHRRPRLAQARESQASLPRHVSGTARIG